jgi:hypothetical protein
VPDWERIAELTREKRAAARDAKALILVGVREGRQPTEEERRRLRELEGAASQLDDELERAFYEDLSGT